MAGTATVLTYMILGACRPRREPTDFLVYKTAHVAVALWVLGSAKHLWLRSRDWTTADTGLLLCAVTWLSGWGWLLIHTWTAFRLVHHWSHAAAFADTARTAGVGEGVYVNYLVLLVWGLDATWLAAAPERYARRPRWVGWVVHGFLAFVMFNATVVYGHWPTQWAGVGWFAILGLSVVRRQMGRPA
ncbi:MAG: hypothetical protein U0871_02675 [Gemmataceae bacterium]